MKDLALMLDSGVPLINVHTGDSVESQDAIVSMINERNKAARQKTPVVVWDCIRGLRSANTLGQERIIASVGVDVAKAVTTLPMLSLQLAELKKAALDDALIILNNPHFQYATPGAGDSVQAIQNMRDLMELRHCRIVMLVPFGTSVPNILTGDIMVVEDAPPDRDTILSELRDIETAAQEDFGTDKAKLSDDEARDVCDLVSGFSLFSIRQIASVSVQPQSKDQPDLFNKLAIQRQKAKQIENVPGLEIWDGNERFSDLANLDQLVWFCEQLKSRTRIVVLLDEIEKQLGHAGSALDGGASIAQFGLILSFMEDKKVDGLLLAGHPGNGKSHIAKALANEAGCMCLSVNWGRSKGRYVGETEGNTARILKTIESLAGTGILFVATSNNLALLPPELQSRFTLGTFMVELPEGKALNQIWDLRRKEFGVESKPWRDTNGMSGRDIRNACRLASTMNVPLADVKDMIVPTYVAHKDAVEHLRVQAHGRYLDASKPGVYTNKTLEGESEKEIRRRRMTKSETWVSPGNMGSAN